MNVVEINRKKCWCSITNSRGEMECRAAVCVWLGKRDEVAWYLLRCTLQIYAVSHSNVDREKGYMCFELNFKYLMAADVSYYYYKAFWFHRRHVKPFQLCVIDIWHVVCFDLILRFDRWFWWLLLFLSGIEDMFSTMLSGGGGNRRATSLGKGHLSQAAAARLARTSSWNDGLDGAGNPTPSTNNTTATSSSTSTAGHHSILRVRSSFLLIYPRDIWPVVNLEKTKS